MCFRFGKGQVERRGLGAQIGIASGVLANLRESAVFAEHAVHETADRIDIAQAFGNIRHRREYAACVAVVAILDVLKQRPEIADGIRVQPVDADAIRRQCFREKEYTQIFVGNTAAHGVDKGAAAIERNIFF